MVFKRGPEHLANVRKTHSLGAFGCDREYVAALDCQRLAETVGLRVFVRLTDSDQRAL